MALKEYESAPRARLFYFFRMGARLFLLSVLLLLNVTQIRGESSPFASYQGILRHHALRRDQRASLDLIFDRTDGDSFEIVAILKLRFGDEAKGEYVSYVFDNARYNVLTGAMAFDQADQGLTIVSTLVKGARLEGKVRAPLIGDQEVSLILDREATVTPEYPLLREMTGIYQSESGVLELQAFRSPSEKQDGGSSPFGENEIRGHLARVRGDLGGKVVDSVFTETSYDFFKGRLELLGNLEPLSCRVGVNELTCDGEVFKRVEPERVESRGEPRRAGIPETGAGIPKPAPVSGQYWGYVHNELLDQYNLAGLNIVSLFSTETQQLELSALGSLHFGDREGVEAIAYKFEAKQFPLLLSQYVLKGKTSEAILKITSWDKGSIQGVWYSRCFGRVGTFQLTKDRLTALPPGSRLLAPLRGERETKLWKMKLAIAPRPVSIHSANPFSPLSFGGIVWDVPRIVIPKSKISGGSYDFYTGRLFLPVEVAGESLFLIGKHQSDGTLDLRINLSNQFGAMYSPQEIAFSKTMGGTP